MADVRIHGAAEVNLYTFLFVIKREVYRFTSTPFICTYITLRQSIKMNHGILDLAKKGWVDEYDGTTTLNWWKKGSQCDKVGGQDGGTLYQGTKQEDKLQMFIDLMCRKIEL